ncbi:MAG: histidine triad nucleotide-binding protein [Proteobacteria bacterium]|jgi:histidine triad (HIT) family protein|nr:histidine triad nucleotide-binding protein [Pseudomonadota bacterium]
MSQNDNLFKKIMRGEIPSSKVYEDDEILAFRDIAPAAPVHILIVPKAPLDSLDELTDDDAMIAGKLLICASKLAKELGFASNGYRCVINTGKDAGQTVPHLHLHLLAGREFIWPAG